MNNITLVGRLTRDPELKHTQSGTAVCGITLAVDRSMPDRDGNRVADFIDVVTWAKTAEFVSRNFTKGQGMAVAGELQSRDYTDRDGNKRRAWEVVARTVEFAGSKPGGAPSAPKQSASAPVGGGFVDASTGEFKMLEDTDDVPF